ncbi:MAG: glycoside hydrolase family 3 protein [Firmicutes bacterium]|nr:glycoside hydrolase family 3 protein [Bacillota bacterium]
MISKELKFMVGQMIMAGFPSPFVDDQAKKLLSDYQVGNFIYFARNIQGAESCARLSKELSDLTFETLNICPFISTDQEGGIVSRLIEGAALIPGAAATGAAVAGAVYRNSQDRTGAVLEKANNMIYLKVRSVSRSSGEIQRACGINLDLAPDLDVNIEPANPIIGARSLGDDPVMVAKIGICQMEGLREGGVVGSIKHYPGHGNVRSDSHLGIPVNDTPKEVLMETEFKPFEEAIRAGAKALLTSHVRYTDVDPENPATLSKVIITDLLRATYGFNGIAMTDCLEMDAIRAAYGCGEGAVRAIEAGIDILTVSHTYGAVKEVAEAIYQAIESGRISPERIRESFDRIISLKREMGLDKKQEIDPIHAGDMVQTSGRLLLAQDLMEGAITLLKGDFDLDPVKDDYLVVSFDQSASNRAEDMRPLSFGDRMSAQFQKRVINLSLNAEGQEVEDAIRQIDEALAKKEKTKVILGLYNARFRSGQKEIIQALRERSEEGKIEVTAVLLGAPYDLDLVRFAPCVITTYEYTRLSLEALTDAMKHHDFPGKSPFKL